MMNSKHVILVTGTWGEKSENEWHQNTEWVDALALNGIKQLDRDIPFLWSSNLDGLFGENYDWIAAGAALKDYIEARQRRWGLLKPLNIITHSHGMNVVAYAMGKFGLEIDTLITVAGPRRDKMVDQYVMMRELCKCWVHVHSDRRDIWQTIGSLRWLRPWPTSQKMTEAHANRYIPRVSHTGLMDFACLKSVGVMQTIKKGEL